MSANHSTTYGTSGIPLPSSNSTPTAASVINASSTAVVTPTCTLSSLPQPFIMRAQTSSTWFVSTWNATIGGFELVDGAAPADATLLYINSTCDGIYCGLDQLSFNYTSPESGDVTAYGARIRIGLPGPGPVTFFDSTTAASLTMWSILIAEWSQYLCQLSVRAWGEHDLSAPLIADGVLDLSGQFNDQVALVVAAPMV